MTTEPNEEIVYFQDLPVKLSPNHPPQIYKNGKWETVKVDTYVLPEDKLKIRFAYYDTTQQKVKK